MAPAEFNTAMIHFYRGEVQRSNTWRNRLDTTTNWAVLDGRRHAVIRFQLSQQSAFRDPDKLDSGSDLPADGSAPLSLLRNLVEPRARDRNRILCANAGARKRPARRSWAEHLAADLITPHFTISEWEAVGRRLRRNYLWIFALLALSWNLKVYLHPLPARDFNAFIDRATVGLVPGWVVFVVGVVFNAAIAIFAIGTVRLREATGEVLPQHQFSLRPLKRMTSWTRVAAPARDATTVARQARAPAGAQRHHHRRVSQGRHHRNS